MIETAIYQTLKEKYKKLDFILFTNKSGSFRISIPKLRHVIAFCDDKLYLTGYIQYSDPELLNKLYSIIDLLQKVYFA